MYSEANRLVRVTTAACPTCGAPLKIERAHRHVICVFCNTSALVHETQATQQHQAPQVQLTKENISQQDIERLKQLVLDGKRDEAIDHYARIAAVGRPEAEQAVNDMLLGDYRRLTRSLPINTFGFFLYLSMIGVGLAIAAFGFAFVRESPAYIALIVVGLLFAVWRVSRFVPKVASTWIASYGAQGRARILKCAILRTHPPNGGTLVQVAFEVEPSSGGPRFIDEEILFLVETSVDKLKPGNIIPVRYDEPARQRVFPTSPVTVIGTAPSA